MKRQLQSIICMSMALLFVASSVFAQERYKDEVFTDVSVTSNVVYGNNISIFNVLFGGEPGPEDLLMDVYEPIGDTVAARPVVIFAHRGDFLPAIVNQSPYGSKTDSAVVEICKLMARRGYVAVSMTYRLGWNPFGSSIEKKSTILQAAYRTGQDIRTCVRYMRKQAVEDGNVFGVDTARIAAGAFDAAGFSINNVAYLKSATQTELPKFLDLSTMPPTPFVHESVFGDPYATSAGQLCIPNHVGYSSEVSAIIDIEGGLGEFDWIEAGDPPVIAFLEESKFARPGIRDVTEGVTSEILIADGAFPDTTVYRAQELGNQDIFINANFDDDLSKEALARSGGIEGLFLFRPQRMEGSVQCDPTAGASATNYGSNTYAWNWYDEAIFSQIWDGVPGQTIPSELFICDFNVSSGNPNDPAVSRAMLDTMVRYIAPRLFVAMGLDVVTKVDNNLKADLNFKLFPNPAQERVTISANSTILDVQLMDLQGRLLLQQNGIEHAAYQVPVAHLAKGIYFAKVRFKEGIITQKLVIK